MDVRKIQIPTNQADVAEQVARKKGMTLEEFVVFLLSKEVCDTSTKSATKMKP